MLEIKFGQTSKESILRQKREFFSPLFVMIISANHLLRVHAHHLRLLELLGLDEVPSEGGGDLGHDGRVVLLHGVVPGLGEVAHEAQDGDPQGKGREL